jgi:hypothetical protein
MDSGQLCLMASRATNKELLKEIRSGVGPSRVCGGLRSKPQFRDNTRCYAESYGAHLRVNSIGYFSIREEMVKTLRGRNIF